MNNGVYLVITDTDLQKHWEKVTEYVSNRLKAPALY